MLAGVDSFAYFELDDTKMAEKTLQSEMRPEEFDA